MEMSTVTPEPSQEDHNVDHEPRWRRLVGRFPVRTVFGLLVLGVIMGALVILDRRGSDGELGPLDGRSIDVGSPAPEFALRDPDGTVRRLSDYRGQVVWINFWATWCGPCRRELPDIQNLANEFQDQGLVVLTVNQAESADQATSFWEELDLDLPILLDSSASVSERYRKGFGGLPKNFFIDRDGTLHAFQQGFLTEGQMLETLAELGLERDELLDAE